MPICKIRKVITDQNSSGFLAKFESSLHQIDLTETINTQILEKNGKQLVATPTDKCIYSNNILDDEENLCRTIIAVRKKNNKVVLFEVKPITLSVTKKNTTTSDNKSISNKENIRELNKQFGTKKAKRATELRERMKVDIGTVKEHLETTIAGVDTTVNTSEIQKQNDTNELQAYQPPINRNADKIEDVYNLNDFITSRELNEFKDDAEKLLKSTYDDIQNCCPYITEEIAKLQSENCTLAENEKIKRISLLLYAQVILLYLKTSVIQVNRKSFDIHTPLITSKLRKVFAICNEKNAYMRPASMRDKAICYVLVLFFIVSERHFIDTEEVAVSLKVPLTKLQQFAKICGAQPMAKSRKLYEIRLPIPEFKLVFNKKSARKM